MFSKCFRPCLPKKRINKRININTIKNKITSIVLFFLDINKKFSSLKGHRGTRKIHTYARIAQR